MADETKVLTTGSNLNQLDIFLNANGTAINASGVSFLVRDAADTPVAPEASGLNPSVGKYTASGTVPVGFSLGNWQIDWTVTTVAGEILTITEPFCVQSINISIGFVPETDKTGSIYEAVRLDVGDPDGSIFNDNYLKRILIKSVRRLNQALGLAPSIRGPKGVPGNFGGRRIKVIPITLDVEAGTLTPNNDEYCDLVILQMEYIIASAEISALKRLHAGSTSGPHSGMVGSALNDDVKVKNADGVEVAIGGMRLANRSRLMEFDAKQKKAELDRAIERFQSRLSGNFGKMIW